MHGTGGKKRQMSKYGERREEEEECEIGHAIMRLRKASAPKRKAILQRGTSEKFEKGVNGGL